MAAERVEVLARSARPSTMIVAARGGDPWLHLLGNNF
jgi:hypothetical protein